MPTTADEPRPVMLTRAQASDIIDTLSDRIEHLQTLAIEVPDDAPYFRETIADLRTIRAILDKAVAE